MEILWVSEFPEDSGGIADVSSHIVEGLKSRGYDIDVLNNSGDGKDVIGSVPSNPLEWRKVLKKDYDLVLVQYPGVSTAKLSLAAPLLRGENSLMVMHEVPEGLRFAPLILGFDNFAFLSRKAEEDFQENFGYLERIRETDTFSLPYHGVDRDLPKKIEELDFETGLDNSKKNIVCPGFLVERKQYHKVVEAFPKILEDAPDAELVIAGGVHRSEGSEYLEKLKQIAKEKDIENEVVFTGKLEQEEHLYKYIQEADVCVLPYSNIYQSGILARTLALGTPTVVSRISGLSDPVREYGGLILKDYSTDEISEKGIEALNSDIIVDAERFRKDMSWEKRVERYEEIIYCGLIERS